MNGVHLGLIVLGWFGFSEVYKSWMKPRKFFIRSVGPSWVIEEVL